MELPLEVCAAIVAKLDATIPEAERLGAGVELTVGGQLLRFSAAEAVAYRAAVEAHAAEKRRLAGASPRSRIEHITRDERGEISSIETEFRY